MTDFEKRSPGVFNGTSGRPRTVLRFAVLATFLPLTCAQPSRPAYAVEPKPKDVIGRPVERGNDVAVTLEYGSLFLSIPRKLKPAFFPANSTLFYELDGQQEQKMQFGQAPDLTISPRRIRVNINFFAKTDPKISAILEAQKQSALRQVPESAPTRYGLRGPGWGGVPGSGPDPVYIPLDFHEVGSPRPVFFRCFVNGMPHCSSGIQLREDVWLLYEFHPRMLSQWREVHARVLESLKTIGWK